MGIGFQIMEIGHFDFLCALVDDEALVEIGFNHGVDALFPIVAVL